MLFTDRLVIAMFSAVIPVLFQTEVRRVIQLLPHYIHTTTSNTTMVTLPVRPLVEQVAGRLV